ncbi:MAG: helix-turn-helix transcriptional regulator [Bacteroidales bacterium]|nr:helix-turn-helix transcriptional regulator [Bacteroidales bacterium]
MKEIFAYRLKNARIMHSMSVKKLTELLGVSKQMISKYENGRSMPDGKKLVELANIFGVKPDYFFNPFSVSLEDIKFRKKAKTSVNKVNSVKARVLNQMESYLQIEDILSIEIEFPNPLKYSIN